MRAWSTALLTVLALLVMAGTGRTQHGTERIRDFHSEVWIHQDASISVTETISVLCGGGQIKRGIVREFPTIYRTPTGKVRIGFDVTEVLRDGQPEPYFIEGASNGKFVYIGQEDVFLDPGEYTYTISYETNRQLGFFDGHDELYWNVTGNGWRLPIDHASATVHLPRAVAPEEIAVYGYTGAYGEQGPASAEVTAGGVAEFATTAPLAEEEGLTISVSFPKGIVDEPTRGELVSYWFRDNMFLLISFALTLGVAAFFIITWLLVGRDPQRGPVSRQGRPPDDLSPAATAYIREMRLSNNGFMAALVSLARKGWITIKQEDKDTFRLTKAGPGAERLTAEEQALYDKLFLLDESIIADEDQRQLFIAAKNAVERELKQRYARPYFRINAQLVAFGVIMAMLVIISSMIFAFIDEANSGILIAKFFFDMLFLGGLMIMFALWMPRYTLAGRRLLDRIEGFQLNLKGREHNYFRADPNRADDFELFLPFAIGMGAVNGWAEQFNSWWQEAREEPQYHSMHYYPHWYHSSFVDDNDFTSLGNIFSSSFSSSISSASTPPGSGSGGGGGGFSGGGGGGGGGGGW